MAKNIGFLMKNVPFAAKKAEEHFNKAIELLNEIGAKGFLGPVYLGLAKFYKVTKREEQARQPYWKPLRPLRNAGLKPILNRLMRYLHH